MRDYAPYCNVPQVIGVVVSSRHATLHELGTVYGVKDLYDMLEIIAVDNFNHAMANQSQAGA